MMVKELDDTTIVLDTTWTTTNTLGVLEGTTFGDTTTTRDTTPTWVTERDAIVDPCFYPSYLREANNSMSMDKALYYMLQETGRPKVLRLLNRSLPLELSEIVLSYINPPLS